MNRLQLEEYVLDLARTAGAEYPTIADSSDEELVILDTASGRTWHIKLEEF